MVECLNYVDYHRLWSITVKLLQEIVFDYLLRYYQHFCSYQGLKEIVL